jgi:hypothetical protein
MIRGTILATMEMLFPAGIPSLKDFAQAEGVAPSTFRHSAEWLLGLLPGLFEARRPGPQTAESLELEKRAETVEQLEDLRSWLLEKRSATEKNHCYSPVTVRPSPSCGRPSSRRESPPKEVTHGPAEGMEGSGAA